MTRPLNPDEVSLLGWLRENGPADSLTIAKACSIEEDVGIINEVAFSLCKKGLIYEDEYHKWNIRVR